MRISIEGERGTGKSTVVELLRKKCDQLGISHSINRELETGKTNHPTFNDSIQFHKLWEQALQNLDLQKAEVFAWRKFHCGLSWLAFEEVLFDEEEQKKDLLICDRDIDSSVLYAAVEIYQSQNGTSLDRSNIDELVESIWTMANSVRKIPDLTFYLTSNDTNATLLRSFKSKQNSTQAFNLTPSQTNSQELAARIFPSVFSHRPKPELVVPILSDGKRPDEIAGFIINRLTLPNIIEPLIRPYPTIPLRYKDKVNISSIDDLISIVFNSGIGSAFPSKQEVSQGFSNCVYSNTTFVEWTKQLSLAEVDLVSIEKELGSQINPIHWVAFQYLNEKSGRIIDLTPFNDQPIISSEVTYKKDGDYISITSNGLSGRLCKDDPKYISNLMELAYISMMPHLITAETVKDSQKIVFTGNRAGHKVFGSIRLIRMLEALGNYEKAKEILDNLVKKYGQNLILAREVGRIKEICPTLSSDNIAQLMAKAKNIVIKTSNNLSDTDKLRYRKYYEKVLNYEL